MKLILVKFIFCAALLGSLNGYAKTPEIMSTQNGVTIIDSSSLCTEKGFNGTTPVKVFVKGNMVVKVETLANKETPAYFSKVVENFVSRFNNITVDKAVKLTREEKVDGCTGATFSTKCVQKNISAALDYYNSHKNKQNNKK